nr:hypothetical protein [Tanacetum cinerariifolium]
MHEGKDTEGLEGAELVLEAEELLFPLAGAEDDSFIMIPSSFTYKTLVIPSFLDHNGSFGIKICALDKNFSSIWTYTTMMLPIVRNHHGEDVYIWDLVDFDVTMSSSRGK